MAWSRWVCNTTARASTSTGVGILGNRQVL